MPPPNLFSPSITASFSSTPYSHITLPLSLSPSLPPSLPPSLSPSFSPSLLLSLPPSLPPSPFQAMTNDENVNKLIGLFVYHKSKGRSSVPFPPTANTPPSAPSSSSSATTTSNTTSNTSSEGAMDIDPEKEEENDKEKEKEKEGQKENGRSIPNSADHASSSLNQHGGGKDFCFLQL